MIQASEETKKLVQEITTVLAQAPNSKNVELQQKLPMIPSQKISYGLAFLKSKGLVKREGVNKGARWTLTEGGQVNQELKTENNGHHTVGLVKPQTVEISKSCLKLLVRNIVDRGEHLEGPLQQAVMKALLVLV